MVGCAQEVPSNAEQVLDDPVNREESLGLSWQLEPVHLSLSLPLGLMRDFGPVVRIPACVMAHRRHGERHVAAAAALGRDPLTRTIHAVD